MSGPLNISLKDKLLFIESLLIPAFDPDNELDTSKKRKEWMRQRAINTGWDAGISGELIIRYGTVASLEEVKAERRLVERAEENERQRVLQTRNFPVEFYHDKGKEAFIMTFTSEKPLLSQLESFLQGNVSCLPRGFSLSEYRLQAKTTGLNIYQFSNLPADETLVLSYPSRICAQSASDWDETYLERFKIDFQTISWHSFVGANYQVSTRASKLIEDLSSLDYTIIVKYPARYAEKDVVAKARADSELEHPIRKAIYLIDKYSSKESIVDSFLQILLYEMGFYSGMLYAIPQIDLPLVFGSTKCTARADYGILDVASFYRMAVVEDKSKNNNVVNSEPQLLAEAIAAHQLNIQMDSGVGNKRSLNQTSMGADNPDDDVDDDSNIIYGVRVNGWNFFFYEIPITPQILSSMETQISTNEVTHVKKVEKLDFLRPEERCGIITTLDMLREKVSDSGKKTKRRVSINK